MSLKGCWKVNGWIIAVFIIGFLLFLLLITKLTITILYARNRDDDELAITFKIWYGLISYTFKVPLIKVEEESKAITFKSERGMNNSTEKKREKKLTVSDILRDMELFRDFLKRVIGFHEIFRRFLKHVSIKKFEWQSIIGTNDAALTGVLVGAAWGIKGSVIGLVSTYMKLQVKPYIEVYPMFQTAASQTRIVCMFSFRVGYAIGAALKVVKFWKGQSLSFRKTGLSKETT